MTRLDDAGRRALARLIAEEGLPPHEAAARFGVSASTGRRWARRWEAASAADRRSGRWMRPPGEPDPGGEAGPDRALALAEASIREAEAMMASLSGPPPRRVARRPPPARPRPARPPARVVARVSAHVRAVHWTRRQMSGVGLTLAFIPVGWLGGAAVLGGDPQAGVTQSAREQGGAAAATAPRFSPAAVRAGLPEHSTLAAHARGRSIRVFDHRRAEESTRLEARLFEGKRLPLVFLVERRRGKWLRVQLPTRPNGSTGWIRRRDVELRANPYRVRVLLTKKRVEVWRAGELLGRPRIAVGQALSPTPTGRYFITDLIKARDPDGLYGPYAFGLSAFSTVYTQFRGGPGQIGLHGTDTPELLGTNVSAGCIRLGNRTITKLAGMLPLGTPVEIRR